MPSKTSIRQAIAATSKMPVRASGRALEQELADGVRDCMAAARADNTRKAYRQA